MNFLFLISGWFVSYLNLQSCRIKLDYLFHIKLLPKIISFLCIANLSYIWSIHTANSSFSNHLFQNNQSFFTFIQSKTKGYIYITSTILNFRKMCIIFLCWLMKRGYETHPQLFFFQKLIRRFLGYVVLQNSSVIQRIYIARYIFNLNRCEMICMRNWTKRRDNRYTKHSINFQEISRWKLVKTILIFDKKSHY